MWDLPFALSSAWRLAKRTDVKVIVVNADPWSGLILGWCLRRKLDIPLLADLRDPWSLHPHKRIRRPRVIRRVTDVLERRIISESHRVILNTPTCVDVYRKHYTPLVPEERFTYIGNAFDPDSYSPDTSPPCCDFALHYFGSTNNYASAFYKLLEGYAIFLSQHNLTPAQTCLKIHGTSNNTQQVLLQHKEDLAAFIHLLPRSPLFEASRQLRSASVLLLFGSTAPQLQIPAKLYDYLALQRPILAINAGPDIQNILKQTALGIFTSWDEGAIEIASRLSILYETRHQNPVVNQEALIQYTAQVQCRKYAAVLDQVVDSEVAELVDRERFRR